jgi:hypothetical protein
VITYKTLLKNKRVIFASFSLVFSSLFMLFLDSILSNYLLSIGISDHYIGYVFGLMFLVYALCVPFVGKLCMKVLLVYLN